MFRISAGCPLGSSTPKALSLVEEEVEVGVVEVGVGVVGVMVLLALVEGLALARAPRRVLARRLLDPLRPLRLLHLRRLLLVPLVTLIAKRCKRTRIATNAKPSKKGKACGRAYTAFFGARLASARRRERGARRRKPEPHRRR